MVKRVTPEMAMENIREANRRGQSEWAKEAFENFLMYNGYQWPDSDLEKMASEKRPTVVFNRAAPLIDAIIGDEIAGRKEVKFLPRTTKDSTIPDVMKSIATWVRNTSAQEASEIDATKDMLITGLGVTSTRMNYEDTEQGQLEVERVNPLDTRYDPNASAKNLTDRQWDARYKIMTKEEVEDSFPDATLEFSNETEYNVDLRNKEVGRNPATYAMKSQKKKQKGKKGFTVWDYQYKASERFYKVENPFLGMELYEDLLPDLIDTFGEQVKTPQMNLSPDGYEVLKKITKGLQIEMPQAAKMIKKTVKKLIFIEDSLEILYDGDNAVNRFTRTFMTGKRDEKDNTWYGIMRPIKDPQLYANKLFSTILYTYMTNSKGGVIIEGSNIPDMAEFRREWAKPDGIIRVSELDKIKERSKGDVSPAAAEIMKYSIQAISEASGMSTERVATEQRNRSNALANTRIKQSQAIQGEYIDSISTYRVEWGKLLVQFTKDYLSQEDRLIRVTDEDGEKFINMLKDPLADDYDVVIEEGALSLNQKIETWEILGQMFAGQPLPPPLFRYSPLPKSISEEVIQYLTQKGQPSPEQQQLIMAQTEEVKADTAKSYALAENSKARTAKVAEEVEEKRTQNAMDKLSLILQGVTASGQENNVEQAVGF